MLGSLRITGFRAFSDLTIERLGRVTLVVGRNNVGKTTLLEAVHIHASLAAAFTAAHRMLERRDEYLPDDDQDVDFDRLFFRKNGTSADAVTISAANGEHPLKITMAWAWTEEGDDRSIRRWVRIFWRHGHDWARMPAHTQGREAHRAEPAPVWSGGPSLDRGAAAVGRRLTNVVSPGAALQASGREIWAGNERT